MDIIQLIKSIHESNFIKVENFDKIVSELLDDYFYLKETQSPEWFKQLIEHIYNKKYGKFYLYGSDESNIGSLLADFEDELKWNVNDYGEGVEVLFEKSNIMLFVSREAVDKNGRTCTSCEVICKQ